MMPSGILMRKTARHEIACASHPPKTGPIAAMIAVNPDQVPIARPRASPENATVISERLPGINSAAPIP